MESSSPRIFIDTSWFKAVIDLKDDFHEESLIILEKFKSEHALLITSNFILDETATLIRIKCGLERVKEFRENLLYVYKFNIFRVTPKDEKEAWNWFWNEWKRLSFTDCTCFALMKRLELTRVATFDTHFSQAGFEVEK